MKTIDCCKQIMKVVVEKGFTNQIQRREFEKIIIVLRGKDKRTIDSWFRTLEMLGFIKTLNAYVFELKFDQCPELLNSVIQNGQKKLL